MADEQGFQRLLSGKRLGAAIHGDEGCSILPLDKAESLLGLSFYLLAQRTVSLSELRILGGHWIFALQLRREFFSLLDHFWLFVLRFEGRSRVRLGWAQEARSEILMLCCSLPALRIDLRRTFNC